MKNEAGGSERKETPGSRRGSLSSDHGSEAEFGTAANRPGLPARVIAEAIVKLGHAKAESAFRVCRYVAIVCAALHALAPTFHFLVWGCVDETELRAACLGAGDGFLQAGGKRPDKPAGLEIRPPEYWMLTSNFKSGAKVCES